MMASSEPEPNAPAAVTPAAPELITRAEAAKHCRVCVSSFDRYVRPHLTEKRVGTRILFRRVELEAWLSAPPDRVSTAARLVAEKTACERAVKTTSALANEIADRLRARRARAEARAAKGKQP